MQYIPIILTVALVHLLAVISPGPDFMMIARNSLIYSRKTGIYSAVGLGLGILVHVVYSLVGIGVLISHLFVFSKFVYVGNKSGDPFSSESRHGNRNGNRHIVMVWICSLHNFTQTS